MLPVGKSASTTSASSEAGEGNGDGGEATATEDTTDTDTPETKRARTAVPKPFISFQHPVSELVSKHQGAVFNFKRKSLTF